MSILLSKSSFNLNFESQEKLSLKFHFMNFVHLINTPKKLLQTEVSGSTKNVTLFLKEKDWIIHIWYSGIIYTNINMV